MVSWGRSTFASQPRLKEADPLFGHRLAFAALLSSLTLMTVVPPARAGTVAISVGTYSGIPVLSLTGSSTADVVTLSGANPVLVAAGPDTDLALAPGDTEAAARCTGTGQQRSCSITDLGLYTPTLITVAPTMVALGDGDDQLAVSTTGPGGYPLGVSGGEGNDSLIGGEEADYLDGGPGHDYVVGLGGIDYLLGGDGNDFVHSAPSLDGIGWRDPADAEDSESSCGAGVDMILRDSTDGVDEFSDQASCETDIGSASIAVANGARPGEAWAVGDTLVAQVTATRSLPTQVSHDWETCVTSYVPAGGGSVGTTTCAAFQPGERLTVTEALLARDVSLASRFTWSVPGNPHTWTGDERTFPQRINPRPEPQQPNKPVAKIDPAALLDLLAKKSAVLSLKGKGPSLRGPTAGATVHVVAKLTVAAKLLNKTGKPVLIARVDETREGTKPWVLSLNAAGKTLRARLGAKRTAKAQLSVWVQDAASKRVAARTVAVRLRGR